VLKENQQRRDYGFNGAASTPAGAASHSLIRPPTLLLKTTNNKLCFAHTICQHTPQTNTLQGCLHEAHLLYKETGTPYTRGVRDTC